MYLVLFNDGRRLEVPCGEARMWAILSYEAFNCNVFSLSGGTGLPLYVTDVI